METETVIHSDNDFATVAYLRIKNASLEPKESAAIDPTVPQLLDDTYDSVRQAAELNSNPEPVLSIPQFKAKEHLLHLYLQSSHKIGPWVTVTNVESTTILGDTSISLEHEVRECFETLRGMFNPSTFRPDFVNLNRPAGQILPQPLTLYQHQHIHILHGPFRQRQQHISDVLRKQSPDTCLRGSGLLPVAESREAGLHSIRGRETF